MNKEEIYSLLYTDEKGEVIGLNEVQYLEPPLLERIPDLIKLLDNDDTYIAYQAALILTAWGNEEGLRKIEEFIDHRIHESHNFEPHRISGENNVYDFFSHAIDLYGISGGSPKKINELLKKLLKLYGTQFFQSTFQSLLLEWASKDLLEEIIIAFNEALENGRIFQASQLLPVIAKLDPAKGWELIQKLIPLSHTKPTPDECIAHALKYIPAKESKLLLQRYSISDNILVSEAAKKSLDFLNNQ